VTRAAKRQLIFDLDGQAVPLAVHRVRGARRVIVRVDPDTDGIRLTLPWHTALAEGLEFLDQQRRWIAKRLGALSPRVPFAPGAIIPILGIDHCIHHVPDGRRGIWTDGTEIHVSGALEHLARRLGEWLKKQAKAAIAERVSQKTTLIGKKAGRISIRDTRSRWGSCAIDGKLNFSWRIYMMPEFVFDHIVAHEVAHLAEHNHGPRFHALVGSLTAELDRAEAWLSVHGAKLHRIG